MRALQILEEAQGRPGVMATAPDPLVANLQTFMTTVMAPAEHRLQESPNQTLEAKFDSHDILGWAGSFFSWWRKLNPFDWVVPGAPTAVPDQMRVAMFGDWGTGLYGAPVCAESIAKDSNYDLVLHLGDVYYSGTSGEVDDRFIAQWPKVPKALNRGLNGNHEMYTGAGPTSTPSRRTSGRRRVTSRSKTATGSWRAWIPRTRITISMAARRPGWRSLRRDRRRRSCSCFLTINRSRCSTSRARN